MKGLGGLLSPVKWRPVWEKYKLVLLVLAAGVFLLALPSGRGEGGGETVATAAAPFDLTKTEAKLAQALAQIQGAGEVTVVLTVKAGARQVLAQASEYAEGQNGLEESLSPLVLSKGSGQEETVPLQELAPQFQGALIVAQGGDDPQVKLKLVEAASALTGLGADKIAICKGK